MRSERYCSWVCVSVCVSVKSHLTSEMSNRAIKEHTYLVAYERQKICGDFPETTAFKSYAAKYERKSQYANYSDLPMSAFSAWHTAEGQRVPNDCQQHSALPKTMPTDAASPCWSENWQHHDELQLQREAWPTSAHAHWHSTQDSLEQDMQYAPRVCTLVLFIERGSYRRGQGDLIVINPWRCPRECLYTMNCTHGLKQFSTITVRI